MILYQNSVVSFEYEPSTDILFVILPPADPLNLLEVYKSLNVLVAEIEICDIRKLLIDVTEALDPDLEQTKYLAVLNHFAKQLKKTCLGKLAIVRTNHEAAEIPPLAIQEENKPGFPICFQNKDFATKAEAMDWLLI